MELPEDLFFTKEHEWVRAENNRATVGITVFASEKLGDITFIELPNLGDSLNKDDTFGVVESVKAVSDLFSPVSGKVLEINDSLVDSPEILNSDQYDDGWIIRIEMSDPEELKTLMNVSDYKTYCEEEK